CVRAWRHAGPSRRRGGLHLGCRSIRERARARTRARSAAPRTARSAAAAGPRTAPLAPLARSTPQSRSHRSARALLPGTPRLLAGPALSRVIARRAGKVRRGVSLGRARRGVAELVLADARSAQELAKQ